MDKANLTNEDFKPIEAINPWWSKRNFRFEITKRDDYFDELSEKSTKFIDILIGARRVGKTSIMQNLINSILDKGINPQNIIYITSEVRIFEDTQLDEIFFQIQKRLKVNLKQQIYLFVDEVQDIKGWQRAVKFLYDNFKVKIYLTGSSSLVLKPETSKLTGKFILHEVLPLSFNEFLVFTKRKLFKSPSKNKALVEEYLMTGGYPEFVLKREISNLINIVQSTLYRDLLSVYGIRNPAFLSDLLDYMADKVTNVVSPVKIQKDLKVNDQTAKFYLQYLIDVYLLYPVFKNGQSHNITKSSTPKYYFNDNGILYNRSMSPKIGSLAENAVYLHLRGLSLNKEYTPIYYDVFEKQEIDFYDKQQDKRFEVKYRSDLTEEDIVKYDFGKEITFIVPDERKCHDLEIIYKNFKFVSLWRFLSEKS